MSPMPCHISRESALCRAGLLKIIRPMPFGEARMRLDAAKLMIRKASWLLDSGQP